MNAVRGKRWPAASVAYWGGSASGGRLRTALPTARGFAFGGPLPRRFAPRDDGSPGIADSTSSRGQRGIPNLSARIACRVGAGTPKSVDSAPHLMHRYRALVLIGVAELFGMSLWFSASAVAPALKAEWALTDSAASWLTLAVQLGFVAGTLVSAVLNLPDVMSHPRSLRRLGLSRRRRQRGPGGAGPRGGPRHRLAFSDGLLPGRRLSARA